MPDEHGISADEQKALVERMLASAAFRRTRELPGLLRFLLDNRDRLLMAKDIQVEHFRGQVDSPRFNPGHARERANKLRECLAGYQAEKPEETLLCELPNADDIGGYQLRFRRITEPVSACRRFWAAHLESGKEIVAVADPLLFFAEKEKMFRFMDTNIEGTSRKAALAELKKLHAKEHRDTLIPGHFYIDVGSVIASDLIREFFRSSGVAVPLLLDKQASVRWLKASPVVIGNARTNAAVRSIFGSAAAESFAYRLDEAKFASIHVRNPNNKETDALKSIGAKMDADGNFETPSAELTIGIVTRMPNPRGAGVITFIASDGTFTVKQMAAALTDESQLRAIFTQTGWRLDRPVPQSFEMMFLVRLWPGDIDDEGGEATLLCWRSRD